MTLAELDPPSCVAAPAGFSAARAGDMIQLAWGLPPDCPDGAGDGVFRLFRNGALILETSDTSYMENLTLPVAYSVAWQSSASSQDPSIPSTLLLLGKEPHLRPQVQVQGMDAFVQYIASVAPCPPIVWGTQPDLPYLFDISWNCLPLNTQIIFI